MARRSRTPFFDATLAIVEGEVAEAKTLTVEQLDRKIEAARVRSVALGSVVDEAVLEGLRRYRSTLV